MTTVVGVADLPLSARIGINPDEVGREQCCLTLGPVCEAVVSVAKPRALLCGLASVRVTVGDQV